MKLVNIKIFIKNTHLLIGRGIFTLIIHTRPQSVLNKNILVPYLRFIHFNCCSFDSNPIWISNWGHFTIIIKNVKHPAPGDKIPFHLVSEIRIFDYAQC